MEPASHIIEQLGGVLEVARLAGVHQSRVRRWTYPKERGGTGGTIPLRHMPKLLSEAQQRRLPVRAEDFFPS